MGDHVAAAHGLGAHGKGVDAGDPRAAGGRTHGGASIDVGVTKPLFGKRINVGRFCLRISVTAEPVDAGILAN